MVTHIKALRWLALKLNPPLSSALQSQTVSDFLQSQTRIPFERSEASPRPLAVLAAWELRVLSSDASLLEVITLGCFLIATIWHPCIFVIPFELNQNLSAFKGMSYEASPGEQKPLSPDNLGACATLASQLAHQKGIGYFVFLKRCNWGSTKVANIRAPIGSLTSCYPLAEIQSLSLPHARITMHSH